MADDRDSGTAPMSSPDWEALARYLAGEGDAAERARMARVLAGDSARSALVNALDDALRAPVPAAVSPPEVEGPWPVVLTRGGAGATFLPLRPRASPWPAAGLRAAAAILVVA